MTKGLKYSTIILIAAVSCTALLITLTNSHVKSNAKDKIFTELADAPYNKVGLLLGTSKYSANGNINAFYKYRIDAAVELFKAGKISYILVSGDNGHKSYNEPSTMKADLIAAGIPETNIYLDYAGFRTLDSVVRCLKVFQEDKITIISQNFHNERAIFIADHYNIEAIGYNAKSVSKNYGFKTMQREKLARVKMMIDLMLNKNPKFLGEQISIGKA